MVVTSERLQKLTMGRVTWSKAVFLDDPLFSSSVVADLFWCPRFLRTIFGFPFLASQFYYGILNAYILCYEVKYGHNILESQKGCACLVDNSHCNQFMNHHIGMASKVM